jgi:hypothetical protein
MFFARGHSLRRCIGNASAARGVRNEGKEGRKPEFLMDIVPPNFKEILSGILTLAAREEERVPVAKIHSIFYAMKTHEPILSGLRFSLTGDVCYSRTIEQAIRNLIDWGSLKVVDESTVVIEGTHAFRSYLSRSFTKFQFQAIQSASLRFYDRLHRCAQGFVKNNTAIDRIPEKA